MPPKQLAKQPAAPRDKKADAVQGREPPAAKVKKKKVRKKGDPNDWDEDAFPSLEERIHPDNIQKAQMDAASFADIQSKIRQKMKEARGEDPATLTRRWKFCFSITAIENTTNAPWECFAAVIMNNTGDTKNHFRRKFCFTKSYVIKPQAKKVFKEMEAIFNKEIDFSYKDLQRKEVLMDVWIVSHSGFNKLLGTAKKNLYDMADSNVYQAAVIKPTYTKSKELDVGVVYFTCVVSEIFEFTIIPSNWQFIPRPEFNDLRTTKKLRFEVPRAPGDLDKDVHETLGERAKGGVYHWATAGQYQYIGSKVALDMEAIRISVISGEVLQGKAIVSLGVASEYPIAMGIVKMMTHETENFRQGRVGGTITVTSKSLLLNNDNVFEDDSSIPAPYHPSSSLILYHLNPNMRYLIVHIIGADGLPIADTDYGSSNPFARVKYDGIVQHTPVLEGTLSPTWNHTLYMPVRFTDDRICDRRYVGTLLPQEMASKGYLEIEIWHSDSVPTEFLGGFKLDLEKTRFGQVQEKSICNAKQVGERRAAGGEADRVDEEEGIGVAEELAKKQHTKVYAARRETLVGSWLQTSTKTTVSFDCYFLPDFQDGFAFPKQVTENTASTQKFMESFDQWEKRWPSFTQAYLLWFPEAPKARRFLHEYQDSEGQHLPLCRLITPLALPASLKEPRRILHWIRCMEFTVPPRQRSCGQMRNWQTAENILALRRGSVQDHAMLLCCALLGLRKDAFVCKGTIQGGKEHAWVMTREQLCTITFWETTTATKYHLPRRWLGDYGHQDKSKKQAEDRWKMANPNWKWMQEANHRKDMDRSQLYEFKHMKELLKLPISPWRELYQPDHIVVVPYESIEVIFNGVQLWGNMSNHHPACIYYDMEDDHKSWVPLVREDALEALWKGKSVAIPVGPTLSKHSVQSMERNIDADLKDSIRMIRMRKGQETLFDDDSALRGTIENYLDHLERECTLDADWAYDKNDQQLRPWGAPSPHNAMTYVTGCRQAWKEYWAKDVERYKQTELPVKTNHVLSGVPLHFSGTDLKEIRVHFMASKPIQEYVAIENEDALFIVIAKAFPMPSSVASMWIFVGVQMPMDKDLIREIGEKDLHESQDGMAIGQMASEADTGKSAKKRKAQKGTDDGDQVGQASRLSRE